MKRNCTFEKDFNHYLSYQFSYAQDIKKLIVNSQALRFKRNSTFGCLQKKVREQMKWVILGKTIKTREDSTKRAPFVVTFHPKSMLD